MAKYSKRNSMSRYVGTPSQTVMVLLEVPMKTNEAIENGIKPRAAIRTRSIVTSFGRSVPLFVLLIICLFTLPASGQEPHAVAAYPRLVPISEAAEPFNFGGTRTLLASTI
jgi:hypothetical protein